MRRLCNIALICLVTLSVWHAAESAIPVTEVGPNLIAGQTTAVQSTITAVQAVIIVANQVLELTALETLVDVAGDLDALRLLIADAQVLSSDLTLLMGLFQVTAVPETSQGLVELAVELRSHIIQAYHLALRSQTIILTVSRTIDHILAIIGHAADAIGNLSVSQSIAEAQAKVQQLLAETHVRQGIFERAKSLEAMEPQVDDASVRQLNASRTRRSAGLVTRSRVWGPVPQRTTGRFHCGYGPSGGAKPSAGWYPAKRTFLNR